LRIGERRENPPLKESETGGEGTEPAAKRARKSRKMPVAKGAKKAKKPVAAAGGV